MVKKICEWCNKEGQEKEMIEFGSQETAMAKYGSKRAFHKRCFYHKDCLRQFFEKMGDKEALEEFGFKQEEGVIPPTDKSVGILTQIL